MTGPDDRQRAARRFVTDEVVGGALLAAGGLAGLVWANVPGRGTYATVWERGISVLPGTGHQLGSARDLVNGGLMAVFFLVIGLELGRERREGVLADRRSAALPVVGAAGGMVGAALVYLAWNTSAPGVRGWGIPLATDVAVALAALAVLGRRVPPGVRAWLLALAVADDLGSIAVLAVTGASDLRPVALAGAAVVVAVMGLVRARWQGERAWPALVGAVPLWYLLAVGGVEPALAGVAAGLLVPPAAAPRVERVAVPISTLVVLPVFGLANAGLTLSVRALAPVGATGVFAGVATARVVGKVAGITGASVLAVRIGGARLPPGVRWRHLVGGAAVAGIGFTVPVLVATAVYSDRPALVGAAELGLVAGSAVAFVLGAGLLAAVHRRERAGAVPRRESAASPYAEPDDPEEET